MRKLNALVYSVFVILLTPGWLSAGSVINRATGSLNWNTSSTWIQNRAGTVTFTNGSINVTGTGTSFTTELQVGDVLMLQASPGTIRGTVATILSNTSLRLAVGAAGGGSGTYGRQAVPSSSDDVTIGNPLLAATLTITLNTSPVTVNSLTFAAGSRTNTLVHSGTNSLTVTGGVTIGQPTSNNRINEWQVNAGSASVGGSLSIGGTNTTTTRISRVTLTTGTLQVSGNLAFNSPASVPGVAIVNLSGGSGQLRIGGNLTLTNGSGTLTPGTSSTVVIDGSGSQVVRGGSSIAFYNFTVDKSAGTATPGSNLTIGGNLSVLTGTLNLSTFTVNRTAAGGTIAVSGGAALRIGGTNGFPSNYSTASLNPASTVEYDGSNQTIAALTYGNLTLGGTGIKTMPASTLTLGGKFTATGTTSVTAQGSLIVAGNFTIDPGATFNAGSFTHNIGGNWSNGGTFTASTGTMVMIGTAAQSMSGSVFNNLTIDNPSDVTMLTDETVNGILTMVSGKLITGVNTVHLGSSATLVEPTGATVLGTITTTRNVTATSGTEPFGGIGASITLHGTAPGNTTVTRTTGTVASGNGHNSILRTFEINPAVNSGLFADLSIRYDYTELNGQDAAALELFKSMDNGSTWKNKGGSSDTAAKTIALDGLNGFSDWTAADAVNSLGTPTIPAISGISPSLKNMGDGSFTLTVDGVEFIKDKSTVRFGGSDRTTSYINEHQLTASIPAADVENPGAFEITVYTTGAGSSNPETLTVTPDTMVITATASAGGGISPSGPVNVVYGASQTFAVAPNTGYHIDSVVADGVNLGVVTSHDFNSVTNNHAIDAFFSIDVFTITATASAGGSISPSGSVNVNYAANQSFAVSPNTGYHIDSVVVDGANQGALASYDFNNVASNHSISAYFSIDVFTVTASASAGGSITPAGSINVNYGANQSFAVAPNTGYHIDSVVVDGTNQGALASYDFNNVTSNHSIDAFFSIDVFTITATATVGGSIAPAGSVNVDYNANQSFAVAPNTGYHIDSVVVDGVNLGVVTSHDFNSVTANHSISAYFSIDVFTITATASAGGSITPSGSMNVNYGANQSFSVSPNTGYHIDSVVVDGTNQGALASYDFNNVTSNHSIDAFFSIDVFTITATATVGGSIAPAGSVNVDYNANQSFAVAPNTGYHIDSVVVDGVNLGVVTSHDFNSVTANHSISAYFSIDVFTITATASAGGSITPSGSMNVNYGANQSFSVSPNTGYHIDSVVVDGANQGTLASYDFNNVTTNHSIDAFFSIDVFTVTATASAGGSISPSGSVNVNYGANQSFSVSPNTGYHIDSVVVDGVNLGLVTSHDFNNVTATHSISAYFSIDVFTVTATASAGGSISPSGPVNVNYNANQSFAVSPNTGYHTDSVVVDGGNQGTPPGYDFVNVTAGHSITAWFSQNTFTITASAGPGGSISPSGILQVVNGGSQPFTVTGDSGYVIDSVIVDGVFAGTPSSYTFSGVTIGHSLRAVFVQYTFSYETVPDWNLLSVTQNVPDRRSIAVYPMAIAPVYTYSGRDYLTTDSVDHGSGYWVKLPGNDPVSIDGLPVGVDTIQVRTRWNLVGSVAVPVSVDDVIQDPPANAVTEFFGYDDGYSIADSIMPGKAYWVKTATAGRFILNGQGSANSPKSSAARRPAPELGTFNRLEFAPAGSGTRKGNVVKGLWFGSDPEGSVDPGRFELPPMPPAGGFDVRFGSQTSLAIVPEIPAEGWEIPVLIRSSQSPVEISWTMNPGDRRRYELVGLRGNAVTFRRTIDGSGSGIIAADDGTRYLLSAGAIPAVYALAQNYPNPFNPSTTISFDLPEGRRVRLEVYNVIGEVVSTLIGGEMREAGRHTAVFDATGLPSGVYFYKMQAGEFSAMRKMVLLR